MSNRPALARILPFALFMAFIGLEELLRLGQTHGIAIPENLLLILYPIKVVCVAVVLWYFRRDYSEINWRDLGNYRLTFGSIVLGVTIFVLWINMDWSWAAFGVPKGYNPSVLPSETANIILIVCRMIGAVMLVPVMEELFWRSFLFRYLISSPFIRVSIGKSNPLAFWGTTLLFGLEHTYFVAGMMAGALFNLLFIRSRSLVQCILCHAVANLSLGLYVLSFSQWRFW